MHICLYWPGPASLLSWPRRVSSFWYIQYIFKSFKFHGYSAEIQFSSFWYIQYIFNIYSTFKLQGYWLHIPYKFSTYSIHFQCTVFDSANRHKGSDVDLEDYDKWIEEEKRGSDIQDGELKDHSSDKDDQSMVAAGSGVEPGGHSNNKYTVRTLTRMKWRWQQWRTYLT